MSETIVSGGGGVSALTTSSITSTIPANSKLQEGKKQSLELIVSERIGPEEREMYPSGSVMFFESESLPPPFLFG